MTWRPEPCGWRARLSQLEVPKALTRALTITLSLKHSFSVLYVGQPSSQRYVPFSWALSHFLHVLGKIPKYPRKWPFLASSMICADVWDVSLSKILLFSSPGLHSYIFHPLFFQLEDVYLNFPYFFVWKEVKGRIFMGLRSLSRISVDMLGDHLTCWKSDVRAQPGLVIRVLHIITKWKGALGLQQAKEGKRRSGKERAQLYGQMLDSKCKKWPMKDPQKHIHHLMCNVQC